MSIHSGGENHFFLHSENIINGELRVFVLELFYTYEVTCVNF